MLQYADDTYSYRMKKVKLPGAVFVQQGSLRISVEQ